MTTNNATSHWFEFFAFLRAGREFRENDNDNDDMHDMTLLWRVDMMIWWRWYDSKSVEEYILPQINFAKIKSREKDSFRRLLSTAALLYQLVAIFIVLKTVMPRSFQFKNVSTSTTTKNEWRKEREEPNQFELRKEPLRDEQRQQRNEDEERTKSRTNGRKRWMCGNWQATNDLALD